MDVRTIDIHELLLQQDPFVMVDRLEAYTTKVTTTSFEVRADNLFVENGVLDAAVLAENMAQTCAARLGYINRYVLFRPIQIGFIGAIRKMQIMRRPHVGERLFTTIEVMEEVVGITLVRASVTVDGTEIASAEMKIALQNEQIKEE